MKRTAFFFAAVLWSAASLLLAAEPLNLSFEFSGVSPEQGEIVEQIVEQRLSERSVDRVGVFRRNERFDGDPSGGLLSRLDFCNGQAASLDQLRARFFYDPGVLVPRKTVCFFSLLLLCASFP